MSRFMWTLISSSAAFGSGRGAHLDLAGLNTWWLALVMLQYLVVLRNPEIATTGRFLVARGSSSDAYVEATGGRDTSVPSLTSRRGRRPGGGTVRGARFGSASDGAVAAGEDGHQRTSVAALARGSGHGSETAATVSAT
jgi:hypothetical protein